MLFSQRILDQMSPEHQKIWAFLQTHITQSPDGLIIQKGSTKISLTGLAHVNASKRAQKGLKLFRRAYAAQEVEFAAANPPPKKSPSKKAKPSPTAKPKRARDGSGHFRGDDPATVENEAPQDGTKK